MKKVIGLVAAVFLAPLLGTLGMGVAGGQSPDWCVPTSGPVTDLDDEQAGHARTIVTVGESLDVPEFGVVVALATAAQESMLRNLDHGDRDSLGLFQQRPSTGWGTPEQVRDPVLTSQAFFGAAEHTTNPGLLDIDGWEDMALAEAAQAVQRSGFPDAYAKWEDEAWAWLADIQGTGGPAGGEGCDSDWDGEDPPPLVDDPGALRARAEAFADASTAGVPDPFYGATHYYRLCARLAARMHGRPTSGFYSALSQWQHYVATGVAITDGSPPPPGALLFYSNEPHGHVAVYLGKGEVISNDILDKTTGRRGGVYIVSTDDLVSGTWNLPYVGWAPPIY